MTDATADAEIVEALALRKRTRLNLMLIFLLVASAGLWSAWEPDFNVVELVKGWGHINNLLARMFPPDLEIVQNLGGPLIETLQMALLGTTIPIFIAIPDQTGGQFDHAGVHGHAVLLHQHNVAIVGDGHQRCHRRGFDPFHIFPAIALHKA